MPEIFQMKKQRIVITAAVAAFCMLAAQYAASPGRWRTAAKLEPVGKHCTGDYMLSSLNVTTIAQDKCQLVWIGTSAGINVYDGDNFIQFSHDSRDTTALPDDYINVLHRDRTGRMWIGTQNGLARYEGGCRFARVKLPDAHGNVVHIADAPQPDDKGAVVASDGKRSYLVSGGRVSDVSADNALRRLLWQKPDTALPATARYPVVLAKPRDLVAATYRDADGNTWVGFRNAGYQVLSDNQTAYKEANDNALAHVTEGRDVTCLATVGQHILAGTTLRLYTYDATTDRQNYIFYNRLFGERQELKGIVALDNRRVWLVGNRRLLCCEVSGGTTRVVGGMPVTGGSDMQLGSGVCTDGNIYVSSDGGYLIRHMFGASDVGRISVPSQWYDEETQLALLADGSIVLFMKNMHFALFNPKNGSVRELRVSGELPHGNVDPAFVRQDSRGNVWLGTKRSGLYRLDMARRRVVAVPVVSDVHIQALAEDSLRQLWITTLKDATCYQPHTGAVLMNSLVSSSQNGLNRQFFDNSICLAPNGDIVFGCSDGCKFVPVAAGRGNVRAAQRLRIHYMGVLTASGERLVVNDSIADGSRYTLSHDENSVEFGFFYPNYSRSSSLMFQYRLDGIDKAWSTPTYKHKASYANLAPGKYKFRLRVVTSTAHPPLAERSVVVVVRPAPWASPAAWFLYAACLVLLIFHINRLYLRIRTNRLQLLNEHNERERERRANEMNMNFFANISHEFRNPITIIAGPLLSLRADSTLPESVQTTLNRVCMSVNRMLRLIDQMLDFNQLETDALRLKVRYADAAAEIQTMANAFCESTRVRGITLNVHVSEGDYAAWIDTDKLEKILSNLFTNALKHTPDGGTIEISARTGLAGGVKRLSVRVYNSGSHIDSDRLADVFKRYYQLADAHDGHHYGWGTGIGLYYVKRLVGLHHGDIDVANVEEGCGGVEFTFSLPIDGDFYTDGERAAEPQETLLLPVDGNLADTGECVPKEKTKILIVDDDIDVAQYIRSIFAADYVVENRYSAEAALDDIASVAPDIILSDVVMGDMSGYEFCRRLKSDLMTSHIPVIMVTAKADMSEQVGGLSLGAVAYVTKPFDPAYLRALVKSQLDNALSLRRKLGENTETEAVADQLSDEDRRFMDDLYRYMKQRAAEQELNVPTVCHDLLISQSKFNYKLKQLTGDTPGVFFRKYKLNRAAQLLHEGTYNVSEVAAMTGFGTAAHFSVAFKKQFGVVPSEY